MRKATTADTEQLVGMMAEFYSESPYPLNPERAAAAFGTLLADERLGHVWFVEADGADVGYVVVTLVHSMNFGGPVAIVDDFFVRRGFRGRGLGSATMAEMRAFCAGHGIRAIHVETGRENGPALAVYRRQGFVETGFVHLTLALSKPTHAP